MQCDCRVDMFDKFTMVEFLTFLLSVTSVIGICFFYAFCGLVLDICIQLIKRYNPKERQKRKVLRQLQNGEIDYDARIDKLIYTETQEELRIDEESDVDSDD